LLGARSLGCSIVNIGGKDFLDKRTHLVMGVLWQVIKMSVLKLVQLDHLGGEDLSNLPPEVIVVIVIVCYSCDYDYDCDCDCYDCCY
jgi:hypothetical protein